MSKHGDGLDRWREQSDGAFVTDGIVDDELWLNASKKILYMLKEPYDLTNSNSDWDLRELARQGGSNGQTFRELHYWTHALLNLDDTLENQPNPSTNNFLLNAAVVNIKKTSGNAVYSDMRSIEENAQKFGDLLIAQIDSIDPDLIVCGSTFEVIRSKIRNIKQTSSYGYTDSNGRLFIDFWHPANRFPRIMNCYTLRQFVSNASMHSTRDS